MRSEDRRGVRKVAAVVGAKIESRPVPRPRRKRIEKRRLQQAVFVMSPLGPGIGEKGTITTAQKAGAVGRQCGEESHAASAWKKMEVGQLGAVALADGALDPLADEIDADAQFARDAPPRGR